MSDIDIPVKSRGFRVGETLFFAILALLIAWPAARWAGVNAQVRFATTVQIVKHGTLELGPYARTTNDKAIVNGRAYSDKAPGLSFLLVPFYALARLFTDNFNGLRLITRLLSLTLAVVVTLWAWSRRMEQEGVGDADRMTCLAFFGIGTVAWAYWSMLYSHGPAALCVFWGVWWLLDYRKNDSESLLALSGAAFGLAILLEYPAAVLGGVAGLYLLTFERRIRRIAFFAALGALLPGLLLIAYNMAVFGKPFAVGYQYENYAFFREQHARGFMGVGAPSMSNLYAVLVSPTKGLIFWSPSVLAGVAGLAWMVRHRRETGLFLVLLVLAYLVVLSGYYDPTGGACFGPRHLVPLIGPLALAMAAWLPHASATARGATRALVAVGAVLAGIGVVSEPHVHETFKNPLHEFLLPIVKMGRGSGNVLRLPDETATIAVFILIAVGAAIVAAFSVRTDKRSRRRGALGFGAVVAVCAAFYIGAAPRLWKTEPGLAHQAWANYWSLYKKWDLAVDEYAQAYEFRKDPYILYYRFKALRHLQRRDEMGAVLQQIEDEHPGFMEWVLEEEKESKK